VSTTAFEGNTVCRAKLDSSGWSAWWIGWPTHDGAAHRVTLDVVDVVDVVTVSLPFARAHRAALL
jgi:hypothetical protein